MNDGINRLSCPLKCITSHQDVPDEEFMIKDKEEIIDLSYVLIQKFINRVERLTLFSKRYATFR